MFGDQRRKQFQDLKNDLQQRLHKHLSERLPKEIKLSLSSTQLREILASISDYVYDTSKQDVEISNLQKKGWHKDQPGPSRSERSAAEEFQKELDKL
jgi:hypothetical protein